jgi:hypothetical protein
MPHVSVISDIVADMKNIHDKCNKKPNFGNFQLSPNLEKICKGKTFEEARPELESYLKLLYESHYIKTFQKTIQELWDNIEKEFFKRMDTLMKESFTEDIKAYITTIGICPYNPKEPSFMVSLNYSIQRAIGTFGHEIMHLYFHKFYWYYVEEKIGPKKTGDLKEALTVLLNHEFIDLWLNYDVGYDEHKDLREFISTCWKEEKDFEKLLEKCIDYLKDK